MSTPINTGDADGGVDRLCRNNAVVYLKALLAGQEVELENRIYRLFRAGETMETTFGTMEATCVNIMTKRFTYKDNVERVVWLGADMQLAGFIASAEATPFGEAFLTGAQTVLTRDARERAARRARAVRETREAIDAARSWDEDPAR